MRRLSPFLTGLLAAVLLAAGLTLPAPAPAHVSPVAAHPRTMTGGSWNMEKNRDPQAAAHQALTLMDRHGLDWLLLQESGDYLRQLGQLPGVRLIADPHTRGAGNTAILVRDRVDGGAGYQVRMTEAGWVTVHGAWTAPKYMTTVLLEGWLRLGSVHLAPSVDWPHYRIDGPFRRVASYKDHSAGVVHWFDRHPAMPTIIAGDWNATPRERGRWTPYWTARSSGAGAWVKAPAGRTHDTRTIDYGLTRWLRVDTWVCNAWGDHRLVVYRVTDNR